MNKHKVFVSAIAVCMILTFSMLLSAGAVAECACIPRRACTCLKCMKRDAAMCICNTTISDADSDQVAGSGEGQDKEGNGAPINPDSNEAQQSSADQRVEDIIFGTVQLRRVYSQEVKHLQIYLNAYLRKAQPQCPEQVNENGIFDEQTERLLRQFQIEQGIPEHDFVGEKTKERLICLLGNLIF